jgi:hypothetical protein
MRKFQGISWGNLKVHLCVMSPCIGNNVTGDVAVFVGDKWMSVQFNLMLAFCCNDHTEIPDGWYAKASPQICFTSHLTKILRNFVPLL